MKKYVIFLILLFVLIPFNVDAKTINLYLFYGDGCPHCHDLEEYLDSKYKNDDINIYKYEVWYDSNNQRLWEEVQEVTDVYARGVPYLVVGDEVIQGFMSGSSEDKVDKAIDNAKNTSYNDNTGIVLGVVDGEISDDKTYNYDPDKKEVDLDSNQEKLVDIPLLGKINLSSFSIPVVAIITGLVDGFNPCAMWILVFLITMLFNYPSRSKMWILGGVFLLTSAFVYFLFMISFLNLAMFMNSITILKILIALFALIFGFYNIYRFFKTKDIGCDVVDKTKRKNIMIRIKRIVENKKFILSLLGIIVLAVSVNLIELLCSLGLPVMFTEILAYNNITGTKNILYILLYVICFLLDDLIVFVIAMKTLKISGISNKYSRYSHLVGGIIMILIGLLMIFKPEWLMFNF